MTLRFEPNHQFLKDLEALRREFHSHPELSGQEEQTAKRIVRELNSLGLACQTGIAGHGVVAEIPGKKDRPYIALRADMDALPIHEETCSIFSSKFDGKMHACAHDGHMTMLIGAARILLEAASPPELPVRLLFQPSEETGEGAMGMIAEGLLEDVAAIYGGHIDCRYPVDTIIISDGAVNASSDDFTISIQGQGAHGARPHEAVDALVAGSSLVMALQTIVSREIDPASPAVISVGQFQAGTAPNIIPGRAVLSGTIRAHSETVREQLIAAVCRVAQSTVELYRVRVECEVAHGTPPLLNSVAQAELARSVAREVVGSTNVGTLQAANMGAEDFAHFLKVVPGAYVRFGAQIKGREPFPAHSSRFDFSEEALLVGANFFARIAQASARDMAHTEGMHLLCAYPGKRTHQSHP